MNELIEDYQRKINTINELLKDSSNSEDTIKRLKIKVGCYRSFLTDLNRALNIDNVSRCDKDTNDPYKKLFIFGFVCAVFWLSVLFVEIG